MWAPRQTILPGVACLGVVSSGPRTGEECGRIATSDGVEQARAGRLHPACGLHKRRSLDEESFLKRQSQGVIAFPRCARRRALRTRGAAR